MSGVISSRAIRLHPAFDDPGAVQTFVEGAGPYVPLALTAQSKEEQAHSGESRVPFIPPWFRRDLATHGEIHVEGAEPLLDNPNYAEAAGRVFPGADLVEPTTVYVNVMGPAPYPFVAHTDIPVFRYASRKNCPVWLLNRMKASKLFEDDRLRLVTAVAWFYDGPGGAFHYWPDGPDGTVCTEDPPFDNVAVVADNEAVYHGVGALGPDAAPTPTDLSIDAIIEHDSDAGRWTILDPEPVLTYQPSDVRITISWKAEVFADADERESMHAAADDPLPIDRVVARFMDDLRARGIDAAAPDDPRHDSSWIDLLEGAYPSPAPRIPSRPSV